MRLAPWFAGPIAFAALGLAVLFATGFAPTAHAAAKDVFVLTYKGDNKWVAPEDNKPLTLLLKLARTGTLRFSAKLPAERRPLAIERLQVLQDLLAREAKAGIIIEEIDGRALPDTLWVRPEQ